ncbi:MAG: hypothetical protein HY335_03220 [Deinococcus sp.]|nr:hypothetical protein [Deinococcus sp.]
MIAIGLGKRSGAEVCHAAAVDLGYEPVLHAVARVTLATGKIIGGLGIVENGYDQTTKIVALAPEQLESGEEALLHQARALMGQLPFQQLHVLVVDLMGKNISGAGMDPNVIGRDVCSTHSPRTSPSIRRIYVRDLHPASHGNALGIGLADFCSSRLVEKIDWNATLINSLTSASPESGRLPLHFKTDQEALNACLATSGRVHAETVRLLRIKSTLEVGEFWASEALLPEVKQHPRLSILNGPVDMMFDAQGSLAN